MANIVYISGGERSGKSSFAMKLCSEKSENSFYLATAKRWDEDFSARIDRHISERGEEWNTIEEPLNIGDVDLSGKFVVLDCVTLWLTNVYDECNTDLNESLEFAKEQWNNIVAQDCSVFVVSNELGMGLHASEYSSRKFVELQGFVNQYIASLADEAYFMVSGIPVKIK